MRDEDKREFAHRLSQLSMLVYELASWLDERRCTDSAIQCQAVLNKIDVVRDTFIVETGSKNE